MPSNNLLVFYMPPLHFAHLNTLVLFPSRSSNQVLKVAGVTLLAGILIAGQAFTAYMAYNQKEQLNILERRSDRLHEISRKSGQQASCLNIFILWASLHTTF